MLVLSIICYFFYYFFIFFFNDTATTEIYTLSLHDALPICALEIYLLDKNDQRRYGLKIWEAYPKTIGPIALGYATNNEIVKTEVAFSWRYWTSLDIKQQAPNLTEIGRAHV